ncbi:hypothetical protein [Pedobacter sp. SYP-B3415]|uniref:hypothetical protein n=1 Tax=Pedobacter sp. SYP-B3415 TaxID=2496641 RepID=UPI00101DFAAB|nr:hypothetical protein [Pedobacter sp. SYP-B3415]
MKNPTEDYQQPKATGGEQKVILNEKETAETDERDPKFITDENQTSPENSQDKFKPGNDAKTELI